MIPDKQVAKEHYSFQRYCYPERWSSYYYQLQEILELKPETLLEVGAGDYVIKHYIQDNAGVKYTSMDIADDLKPDLKGSIDAIPLADNSFDMAIAFEVLEHIPFENVPKALSELARVAKKNVIISVPHFGPSVKLLFKIPFLREIKIACKIPFPKKHVFNGQHYWELGKKDFPPKRLRALIEKHFEILKEFVPFESQYHHFFVLKKK